MSFSQASPASCHSAPARGAGPASVSPHPLPSVSAGCASAAHPNPAHKKQARECSSAGCARGAHATWIQGTGAHTAKEQERMQSVALHGSVGCKDARMIGHRHQSFEMTPFPNRAPAQQQLPLQSTASQQLSSEPRA
eukprot:scaffold26126_cov17-Tisochrysis_lutea.AAC.2